MTERELKSLSKKQLLTLLSKQDGALEKLTRELENTKQELDHTKRELVQTTADLSAAKQQVVELGASPTLLNDIVKAANETADKYISEAEKEIDVRMQKLKDIEDESSNKIKTAETQASLVVSGICSMLDKHIQNVHTLYAEFHANLRNVDMAQFLPPEKLGIGGNGNMQSSEPIADENSDYEKIETSKPEHEDADTNQTDNNIFDNAEANQVDDNILGGVENNLTNDNTFGGAENNLTGDNIFGSAESNLTDDNIFGGTETSQTNDNILGDTETNQASDNTFGGTENSLSDDDILGAAKVEGGYDFFYDDL